MEELQRLLDEVTEVDLPQVEDEALRCACSDEDDNPY